MTVAVIEHAVKRAIEVRGTVMLAVRDDARQWCAVCVAVDESLELRVGEPGRLWRRRGRRRGEAWLRDHGFVQVIDAWAKPVRRGTSTRSCAQTLEVALREGLAAREDADLAEALVHPGAIGAADPPRPDAAHAEHIRFALVALARRGNAKLLIAGGQPASAWAWAFAVDGELILSPESPDDDDEWSVPLADEDAADAADQLTDRLHTQLGRDRHAALFISFMPLEPTDPPLL